mgnify:FL=1|jgi:hypothetical protein
MYESYLEWLIIGLLLVNVIALNNWHRIMHQKMERFSEALNLLAIIQMVESGASKSSDEIDVENALQILRWDMGEDDS